MSGELHCCFWIVISLAVCLQMSECEELAVILRGVQVLSGSTVQISRDARDTIKDFLSSVGVDVGTWTSVALNIADRRPLRTRAMEHIGWARRSWRGGWARALGGTRAQVVQDAGMGRKDKVR